MTTWYQVILPPGYNSRERNDSFGLAWTSPANQGVSIPWGTNFGGGMVTLTASINVSGVNLSDTVYGLIEGSRTTDNDRIQIINYLKQMKADNGTPSIRSQVGSNDIFFAIACVESCGINHFYPSIGGCPGSIKGSKYGIPKGSVYPIENSIGDGGFGIMQLTEWDDSTLPSYEQIWNWQKNIDASVEVVQEKLDSAKGFPQRMRSKEKYKKFSPILPDFTQYQLRMDVYSLYRGGHYWKPSMDGWILNLSNSMGMAEATSAVKNEGKMQCQ